MSRDCRAAASARCAVNAVRRRDAASPVPRPGRLAGPSHVALAVRLDALGQELVDDRGPLVSDGTRLTGPSLLETEPEFGLFGALTRPLDAARVAGQDA